MGTAETDSVLGRQLSQAATVLQVLVHEPDDGLLLQTGIGMAMHGCVKPGLVGSTSTISGLTPPYH